MVLAIGCAVLGACCFGWAAMLQHDAVRTCSSGRYLGSRAFLRMIRTRQWLAGTGLAVTGCGLHVTALAMAPLVIVQPIGVFSLVLIVLLSARARGVPVAPGVRAAVTCVCVGTGGFVVLAVVAGTMPGTVHAAPLGLVVLGALALTGTGLATRGRARCLVLGAAAAVLFGTGSALVRTASLVITSTPSAGVGLAVAAAVVMLTGGWVQHQAYHSGPPAVVVATTTVIDPLTAVAIGIGVNGEAAQLDTAGSVALTGFAMLAAIAVLVLARWTQDLHPRPTPPPPADHEPRVLVDA